MTFEQFWSKLNEKKKIDGDVRLSPEQFEKMLKQAFDVGYKDGCEKTKVVFDMLKQYNAKPPTDGGYSGNPVDDLFGKESEGDVADFLKGIFSKKK